ncbi:MAG: DUF86 domain-containing protein [candidate division NC10 bacterium]|nr:DUF86 domain-containing protein [candidate division NC10 bacterium]
MPSKKGKWKFRIRHILDAIGEIQSFAAGMSYEQFSTDTKTLKAIVWDLMLIGEATRHVPPEVEEAYPEVPWPQMRGMRSQIVHGYDQIDLEIVWKVVRDELPPLLPMLKRILQEAQG